MKFLKTLLASAALLCGAAVSHAQYTLLVSQSTGDIGYGYGFSSWSNFTSLLNTTSASNSFTVSTVSNLSNAATVAAADALLIDQRWTSGSLSSAELTNISAFIASGKRVLFIGENSSWATWDNQFLSLVGDSFAGSSSATAMAVGSSPIVSGVSSVYLPTAGFSAGTTGTALFNVNFSRLYGSSSNVLTVLDVNVFSDSYYASNSVFAANVTTWLESGVTPTPITAPVPEPSTYGLMGAGALAGLGLLRRFRGKRKVA